MSGNRYSYRVQQRRPFLRVKVVTPGAPIVEGRVLDLAREGVGAVFERAQAPGARKGEEVELVFEALILLRPIRVKARIRQWARGDGNIQIGFEFVDPADLERQVPYVLWADFNQRSRPRVPVRGDVPIQVLHIARRKRLRGILRDLSIGGLKMEIPEPAGVEAGSGDHLAVKFYLPSHPDEFRFVGVVRGRDHDSGRASVHMEFDEKRTDDFESQRTVLDLFVYEHSDHSPEPQRS